MLAACGGQGTTQEESGNKGTNEESKGFERS